MDRIEQMFCDINILMAPEKRECGQILVFLGIEINTITMTMKFDKVQCKNTKLELEQSLIKLNNNRYLSPTFICHIAGKLNWYSEILQSGRIHNKYWWIYMRDGNNLLPHERLQLISDTKWWIQVLQTWSLDNYIGNEYKIYSASELIKDNTILLVQSDSSGIHGFEYFSSFLEDKKQNFISKRWTEKMFLDDDTANTCDWSPVSASLKTKLCRRH